MLTDRKTVQKGGFGPKCIFSLKIGRRQRVGADKKSEDKSFSSAFSPEGTLLKRTKMKKGRLRGVESG